MSTGLIDLSTVGTQVSVSITDGAIVGVEMGSFVGMSVFLDGSVVGEKDGTNVGVIVDGSVVGAKVGANVGVIVDGTLVGSTVGCTVVGSIDGCEDGSGEGVVVCVDCTVGTLVTIAGDFIVG